ISPPPRRSRQLRPRSPATTPQTSLVPPVRRRIRHTDFPHSTANSARLPLPDRRQAENNPSDHMIERGRTRPMTWTRPRARVAAHQVSVVARLLLFEGQRDRRLALQPSGYRKLPGAPEICIEQLRLVKG